MNAQQATGELAAALRQQAQALVKLAEDLETDAAAVLSDANRLLQSLRDLQQTTTALSALHAEGRPAVIYRPSGLNIKAL